MITLPEKIAFLELQKITLPMLYKKKFSYFFFLLGLTKLYFHRRKEKKTKKFSSLTLHICK